MTLQITPISVSIHREDTNPIYSEGNILVSIQDEGGGYFFQLSQDTDKINIELDELKKCIAAAEFLLTGVENKINQIKI